MSAGAPDPFWAALEALPALAAVAAEWEALVPGGFRRVRPLLRVRPRLAGSFPNPNGGHPYEVREYAAGEWVGVCPETGDTLPLSAAQLVVHELDRRHLGDAIARAFAIAPSGADPDGRLLDLGHSRSRAAARYGCFLALPTESADVQVTASRLIAEGTAPFVLFAPTRQWLRRAVETLLKFHGCAFLALNESATLTGARRLEARHPLDTLLPRTTGVVSVVPEAAAADQNVFRRDGDTWTLVFAGKRATLVDSLGLRCLVHVVASRPRDIGVVALKALATGNRPVKPLDGFEAVDAAAREGYRRAYEDLVVQLEDATAFGDATRQGQIREQMALLAREVQAAQGFSGRTRKEKDRSASVRTSVKNAIDRTLGILNKQHPELARHLGIFVSTGDAVRYAPTPDVDWVV
jgi:hypothetical protein